jgi:hypothetical protein
VELVVRAATDEVLVAAAKLGGHPVFAELRRLWLYVESALILKLLWR